MLHPHVLAAVGRTPLVRLHRLFPDAPVRLYAKLEGCNPGGSMKDRPARAMIEAALQAGTLRPGDTVIESSSGNMAVGLAQACLYHGLQLIVVVDRNINAATAQLLEAYGATLDRVGEPSPGQTYLMLRLERVQTLLDTVPRSYWPNQYANPANPEAHYATIREIMEDLDGAVDYVLAATSTCGTLIGCARYLRQIDAPTQVVAVDAVGSVLFGGQPARRRIPGHGAGRPSPLLDRSLVDHHLAVSDRDCVWGCRHLLQREAILGGGSSGALVAAVRRMLPSLPEGASCVLILADRGDRYLDTIYSEAWVREHIHAPINRPMPHEPVAS